ncbi:MAG TPA: VCBS repeat-containing protein [Solirubrobacteraceae bacterium]|nr:VCBS repeat-containing protein [Solirubrobacteraceae bacterium]
MASDSENRAMLRVLRPRLALAGLCASMGVLAAGSVAAVAAHAAVVSPPITFQAPPNSPVASGGDAFALAKTATRPTVSTPDLIVSNPTAGTITVLLGDGKGGFAIAPGSPLSSGGGGPTGIAVSGLGYYTTPLPSGHTPGGGSIAVANSTTNNVSLLLGNGSGAFGPAPGSPFAVGGTGPVALGIVSNGAGGFLAAANAGSANVSVLAPNPDGSGFSGLVPGSPFATGLHSVTAMAVGDFNGDGSPDVALVDGSGSGPANVAVLLGNKQGGFTPAPGSPFSSGGGSPDAIAVGDFNDDGKLDLAVANFGSNTVSVLLGDGHGGFALAPGSPFSSGGAGPTGLAPWDFNGDGREDLSVINGMSSTLEVFAGDGTGRLTPQPGFPAPTGGSGPAGILAGDLNADDMGDIAIANRQSHNVSILLNTSVPPSFPLLAPAKIRRTGQIILRLLAPANGMFTELVSVQTHGREIPYGCGVGASRGAGPVSVAVTPTPQGLRAFHRARTLRLSTRALFLRNEVIPPLGVGGGGVRHVARGHKPKRVIVHVARARHAGTDPKQASRALSAATPGGLLGPAEQSRFHCEPPFPTL